MVDISKHGLAVFLKMYLYKGTIMFNLGSAGLSMAHRDNIP